LDIPDWAEVYANFRFDDFGQLFGSVLDPPSIEINGLLIETRKNTLQEFGVACVAVSRRSGADPGFSAAGRRRGCAIVERTEVRDI
jgi:hypothetical protein